MFAVAGRVRLVVLVSQVEPRLESVEKFFDDFLTGSCVQVFPAGLVFRIRFQHAPVGNLTDCVPYAVGCLLWDILDF